MEDLVEELIGVEARGDGQGAAEGLIDVMLELDGFAQLRVLVEPQRELTSFVLVELVVEIELELLVPAGGHGGSLSLSASVWVAECAALPGA